MFTCLNHTSLSALWIGFLNYYSTFFEFDKNIIQIRQKRDLKMDEKNWDEKFMYIEDPFEITHNLARGVIQQMAGHIENVFQIYFEIATSEYLSFTVKGLKSIKS